MADEDSMICEGCALTFDVAEIVLSPYEADDGGAYCTDCATAEWARVVEECSRLRAALVAIGNAVQEQSDPLDAISGIVGTALTSGEGAGDAGE